MGQNKKRLGELLIEANLITREQLETALDIQKTSDSKLGEILLEQGIVEEDQIVEVLEFQLKIPRVNFSNLHIERGIPRLISESLAQRHRVIPISRDNNYLTVAMVDPIDLGAIDEIKIATGFEVVPKITSKTEMQNAIDRYYGQEGAEKAVEDFKQQYSFEDIENFEEELINEVNIAPVVRLVNSIIHHAIRARASDIHIEPFENNFRVRFRVDGELQEIMSASKTAHSGIVTRIKIMGQMDIAEKRIPQDGRVEISLEDKAVDLRISILPTVYGEKIVIRLLGRSDILLTRAQLGFTNENSELFDRIIKSPNGIVLVTGPTGSGKTTTLYAVLRELNRINRNIITVEDPVEYRLEGINQVQVNTKAGLTFSKGLRSILRQDPDIVMIGEIRDVETAQIAVRAAITGHLVLSTMHTNDSASTVSRLVDMGVQPYLVSSSVVGVVAQRLVRRICTNCKTSYQPERAEVALLRLRDNQMLYKGTGCNRCNFTGYKGRLSIHEIMTVNSHIRELIDKKGSIDHIRNVASKFGTTSLRDNCIELVLNGTTTTEELLKVTYSLD